MITFLSRTLVLDFKSFCFISSEMFYMCGSEHTLWCFPFSSSVNAFIFKDSIDSPVLFVMILLTSTRSFCVPSWRAHLGKCIHPHWNCTDGFSIYLFLGNVISVFVSSLILLLRSSLSFIHLPLFPFVPRHQHCVEVTSRATPAPSCLPASQTFTRITWTARGWSRPPTAKVSREILCRHMRQSNSISVTMSFPSTEWPFYFAEQAVFVRPGCWEAGLRLRRHGMILQPLVEHSYQTDWALFADALSAQVQLCLEKDREFVLNVLWYRKYCVFNVFFSTFMIIMYVMFIIMHI